jgi:hypothetical protein
LAQTQRVGWAFSPEVLSAPPSFYLPSLFAPPLIFIFLSDFQLISKALIW